MIHVPIGTTDAPTRVQCDRCLGHGAWIDPKCVPSFHVSPACMVTCPRCDGDGWLYDDEEPQCSEVA